MNNVIVYWQAGIPNHRAFFFLQRAWEKEEANSVQVDVDIKWGAQAFKKKNSVQVAVKSTGTWSEGHSINTQSELYS